MTNIDPFLLNESSKILIFTDFQYHLCPRLLRAGNVIFFENQESISKIYDLRIPKLLSNKILLAYFYLSEAIHNVPIDVRYPVTVVLASWIGFTWNDKNGQINCSIPYKGGKYLLFLSSCSVK